MQNSFVFVTVALLALHVHFLIGVPVINDEKEMKRSDEHSLPTEVFSVVTNEKLAQLKELAVAVHDPKLYDLYDAVNHYVQMATKNNEHVLWKYDSTQEGLVLKLKPNLNGILHYG